MARSPDVVVCLIFDGMDRVAREVAQIAMGMLSASRNAEETFRKTGLGWNAFFPLHGCLRRLANSATLHRHSGAPEGEPGIHRAAMIVDEWILRCAIAHHSSRLRRAIVALLASIAVAALSLSLHLHAKSATSEATVSLNAGLPFIAGSAVLITPTGGNCHTKENSTIQRHHG